jgi:hypothetical protein
MNNLTMKKLYLLIILLASIIPATAQKINWLNVGGSTDILSNGAVQYEAVTDVCVDDRKNTYILAQVGTNSIKADTFQQTADYNFITWHILFAKYDCNGTMRFAKLIQSRHINNCHGLLYDKGKVYVSGSLYNINKRIGYDASFSSMYQSAFLSKFDTSGTYEWTKFVGVDAPASFGTGSPDGSLAVDGSGNIHYFNAMLSGVQITPSIVSTTGNYDLKYDVNGNLLSATKLQLHDTAYIVKQAEIDKATGKYYVLFERAVGSTTHSSSYLTAYNPNGSQIWLDSVNFLANLSYFVYKQNDGIYIPGYVSNNQTFSLGGKLIQGPASNRSVTLSKIELTGGKAQWIKRVIDNQYGGQISMGMLPDNTLVLGGEINGTMTIGSYTRSSKPGEFGNPVLVNIDTNGNFLDYREMYGNGNTEGVYELTVDKAGSVYFGGLLRSNSISAGGLPTKPAIGGNSDFFVGRYGWDCSCPAGPTIPNVSFIYTADSATRQMVFTYTGTQTLDSIRYLFGDGTDTVGWMNPSHIYSRDQDTFSVCITSYLPCGKRSVCKRVGFPVKSDNVAMLGTTAVNIYPNPTQGRITISGASQETMIRIADMMGRQVYAGQLTSPEVNLIDLPPGNYILQLSDNAGNRLVKKIVKQ